MTQNGFKNPIIEGAFDRLAFTPLADQIGWIALEARCGDEYRAGMTIAQLVSIVKELAG